MTVDTKRKGSVEHAIGHTQSTALKGRRFESIEEQDAFLAHREAKWAASRIHGSERCQMQVMLEEESLRLRPVPLLGMQYCRHTSATGVSPSGNRSAQAIRSSVNLDFVIASPGPCRGARQRP